MNNDDNNQDPPPLRCYTYASHRPRQFVFYLLVACYLVIQSGVPPSRRTGWRFHTRWAVRSQIHRRSLLPERTSPETPLAFALRRSSLSSSKWRTGCPSPAQSLHPPPHKYQGPRPHHLLCYPEPPHASLVIVPLFHSGICLGIRCLLTMGPGFRRRLNPDSKNEECTA